MPEIALTMAGRCVRLSMRQIDALITSLALPVLLMLMFVYLFGGAIETGGDYVTYVVPGVILLCAGFGSAVTAVTVSQDMTGGIVDRLRSMDVGGPAVLAGHVAASVVRNAASTALVLLVALLIGFRPEASALDWLAGAGVLLAYVLAISSLAAALGLIATSPEAANGITFVVMFLPYASSAFVPVGHRCRRGSRASRRTSRSRRSWRPCAGSCSAARPRRARRSPGARRSSSPRWPLRAGCSGGGRASRRTSTAAG
jgi:ABC-2 type transport system permease protein